MSHTSLAKWFRPIVSLLACCTSALGSSGCTSLRSVLYPAPRTVVAPNDPLGRIVRVPMASGEAIAFYIPPRNHQPTLVCFHGNGEQLGTALSWMRTFALRDGLGVLAVEYPGYGLAQGVTSEASILSTARVVLDYAHEHLGLSLANTVLLGRSLGTGVAMQLAKDHQASMVILVSAYTSLPDAAQHVVGSLPVASLVPDKFASMEAASEVTVPVLLLHGTSDELIPSSMSEALAHKLVRGRFARIEGANHQDIVVREELYSLIRSFVSSHMTTL